MLRYFLMCAFQLVANIDFEVMRNVARPSSLDNEAELHVEDELKRWQYRFHSPVWSEVQWSRPEYRGIAYEKFSEKIVIKK